MKTVSCLLTILFGDVLAWSHEVSKALKLVAGHRAISSSLKGQVLLKVCVQVLLECDVADESHAADAAVELDSRKNFSLRLLCEPNQAKQKSMNTIDSGYLLLQGLGI